MSAEADDDYELSYNVDDLELDLYQDDGSDNNIKPSQISKMLHEKILQDKNDSSRKRVKRPERPLFRPRPLWSRGRGRGHFSGTRRGTFRKTEMRRSSDSRRKDRSRSRSGDDLRSRLMNSNRSRSRGRRSQSKSRRSRSRDKRSRSRGGRSQSRDRRSRSRGRRSRSRGKCSHSTEKSISKDKWSNDRNSHSKDNYSETNDSKEKNSSKSKEPDSTSKEETFHSRVSESRKKSRSNSRDRYSENRMSNKNNDKNFSGKTDISRKSNESQERESKRNIYSRTVSNPNEKKQISEDKSIERLKCNDKDHRSKSPSNDASNLERRDDSTKYIISSSERQSKDRSNQCRSSNSIEDKKRSRSKEEVIKTIEHITSKKRSSSCEERSGSRKKSRSRGRTSRSKSRNRRSKSDNRHSRDRSHRSRSRSRRSRSRRKRSIGRRRYPDRRSRSRDRRSRSRGNRSRSRDKRSRSRDKGSRSSYKRSRSRCRHSRSRDKRSRSRDKRSRSRDKHSRSKERRSRSRDRRSRSRGRHSISRERRLQNRNRRSKSRGRHSRSRDRRSWSRGRRYNRSRSKNRILTARSSSHSPSRRLRRYSRSRSKSSDVVMFQPRIEMIDVEKYDENRGGPPTGHFDSLLTNPSYPPVPSGVQFRPTPPTSFLSHQFDQNGTPGVGTFLHPPGLEHSVDSEFPPGQPPPPPFITSHLESRPQQFGGPLPQIFTNHPHGQIHNSSHSQEFGYLENRPSEFLPRYPGTSSQDCYLAPPLTMYSTPPKDIATSNRSTWENKSLTHQPPNFPKYDHRESSPPKQSKTTLKQSGVEEERQNQKQTLVIQRDQYHQKRAQLQKELTRLKEHRSDLIKDETQVSDDLLKENTKLQNEVNQRLKAVENVIEMLSGLIKKEQPEDKYSDLSSSRKDMKMSSPTRQRHSSERRRSRGDSIDRDKRLSRDYDRSSPKSDRSLPRPKSKSPHNHDKKTNDVIVLEPSPPPLLLPKYTKDRSSISEETKKPVDESSDNLICLKSTVPSGPQNQQNTCNIIYYDPELHWCSLCNVFPKTASDYLNHLHTPKHKQQITELKLDASPWHSDEPPEPPPLVSQNVPSKRIPIRGVQFLVPSSGWYCRLCKSWIGDMHCAQEHLKGRRHTSNYSEYISQNPHWEVDWLSDRTKSFERSSECISRLREKEKTPPVETVNTELESEKAKLSALSDTLLAVLAQQKKRNRHSSSSSSSSSTSEDDDRKRQKKNKKKKSKKRKKVNENTEKISPTKVVDENIFPTFKQKNIESDNPNKPDAMISSWMESNKIDPPIEIKLKSAVLSGSVPKDNDSRERTRGSHRDQEKMDLRHSDRKKESSKTNFRCSDKVQEGLKSVDRNRDSDKFSDRARDGDKFSDRVRFGDKSGDRARDVDKSSDRARDADCSNDKYVRIKDKEIDNSGQRPKESDKNKSVTGRWGTTKDSFNFYRKDLKDDMDSKKEELMSKKVEEAKKTIEKQLKNEIKELPIRKKKSPVNIFQRPESEDDEPEIVVPDKKDKNPKNDKPQGKLWFPSKDDNILMNKDEPQMKLKEDFPKQSKEDEEEKTSFEKQTEESANKKKAESKKPLSSSNKIKLPFIGRMPLLKKRTIEFKCEEPKEKKSKPVEKKTLVWPNIPNAVEGPQLPPDKKQYDVITENVECATKLYEDNLAEQDMDIANDDLDHEDDDVIFIEDDPKTKSEKDLPPEFQDALDLLFPEQNTDSSKSQLNNEAILLDPSPMTVPLPPIISSSDSMMNNPVLIPPPILGQPMRRPPGPPPGPPPLALRGCPPGPPPGRPLGHPMIRNDIPSMIRPHIGGTSNTIEPNLLIPREDVHSSVSYTSMPPQTGFSSFTTHEEDMDKGPAPKRRNAPSQRMRRHLQKKRAEEAKASSEQANNATKEMKTEKKTSKYEGMDLSDLAMLGIAEDDTIII